MKRILSIMSVLVLTFGAMTGPAHADSGGQYGTTALNCQHSLGAGTVVSANYVKTPSGAQSAAIQLCRSGSYYWAYMVKYSSMPTGYWGNAFLFRYTNGNLDATWSCNATGGNKYIEPGQTMCWTPRVYAPYSSTTFLAQGVICSGVYSTCNDQVAFGQTARTR